MPCYHNQVDFAEEVPELVWHYQHSDYLIQHKLNIFPIHTRGDFSSETLRLRVFCHALLDILPDKGLEEIKESLKDAIIFYFNKSQAIQPTLHSRSVEMSLSKKYERPLFHLSEE